MTAMTSYELYNQKGFCTNRADICILFVGLAEHTLYTGGLRIKYIVQAFAGFFTPIVGDKYSLYYNANFRLIIPILILLAFMWLTCRKALSVFTEGSMSRKPGSLGRGLTL